MKNLDLFTLPKDGLVVVVEPLKNRGNQTMKVFDRARRMLPVIDNVEMVKIHHDKLVIIGKDQQVEEYIFKNVYPKPEGGDVIIKSAPISGEDYPKPGQSGWTVMYRKNFTAVVRHEIIGIEGFSTAKMEKDAFIFCGETNGCEDVLRIDATGDGTDLYNLIPEYHDYISGLLEADR